MMNWAMKSNPLWLELGHSAQEQNRVNLMRTWTDKQKACSRMSQAGLVIILGAKGNHGGYASVALTNKETISHIGQKK